MNTKKFVCECCKFNTNNRTHFNEHNLTSKHINNFEQRVAIHKIHICNICNISCKSPTSWWRHKKHCNYNIINNTKININLYLNENCNNAPNFIDTMKNLNIGENYKENILKNGYVNTICDIIKEQLSKLPIDELPIHCVKNEDEFQHIMHIRHENKWVKETELHWTNKIYKYYLNDYNSDDGQSEDDKQIIFQCLKQMEENIMIQIRNKYGNTFCDRGDIRYAPNQIKIIKCLLECVKLEKIFYIKIIENTKALNNK
jgi:hypothetical protein